MNEQSPEPGTIRETVLKPDGRYLIYYTFADEVEQDGADDGTRAPPSVS